MSHRNYQRGILAGLLAAAVSFGCAQEIGDIDRTQPDYVKKSDLEGEWYFKPTIVETQFTQGFIFEGLEGTMDKIRWEVQEDMLIAYRSYEASPPLDGVEGHGAEGLDVPGSNTPIVAFRILSHFDIQRQYNPSTGIENNVLEENTSDRPWWERDYMRVDWSRNLVDDWIEVGGYASAYYASFFPQTEYISETWESDPYRLRMSPGYIDFTINMSVYIDWETCYYEFADWLLGCGASETKMRFSFRKVDPADDYEILDYPDEMMMQYRERYRNPVTALPCDPNTEDNCSYMGLCPPQTTAEEDPFCHPDLHDMWVCYEGGDAYIGSEAFDPDNCYAWTIPVFSNFGYFRTIRSAYDPRRGFTLDGRRMLINRWDMWEKSFNADGTLIPYAERKTKPIVYYTSVDFPDWLMPSAQRFADDWDLAFRATVAGLRGVEYDRAEPDDLRAKVPERLFEVRRNSCNADNVRAYAEEHGLEDVVVRVAGGMDKVAKGNIKRVCAALEFNSYGLDEPFEWQQLGDLRFAMLNYVDTPQVYGLLGYGPSAADPETGEIISATANIYGGALQSWSKMYSDMISLINGDLTEAEVEGGEYIREAMDSSRDWAQDRLSEREVARIMEQVDQAMASSNGDEDYMPPVPPGEQADRLRLIEGTRAERELLINDEVLRAMAGPQHYQPGQPPSDEALRLASPARWGVRSPALNFMPEMGHNHDLKSLQGNEERLFHFFASRNIMMDRYFAEPSMMGLAHELQGKTREEVHRTLMDLAFEAVAAHEVGHTIGLRHNFAGSADPFNYKPEFWAILTLDENPATAMSEIANVTWISDEKRVDMAQRLNACQGSGLTTQDCLRMREYQYSSIMDYSQRLHTDVHGIGQWDIAAIKFGYGQLMEVFDEREENFMPEYYFDTMLFYMDYTDIPKLVSSPEIEDIFWDSANQVTDAETQIVTLPDSVPERPENIFKRRDIPFKDYVDDYHEYMFGDQEMQGYKEIPWDYCSDTYTYGNWPYCKTWDLGANVTEIVRNARELYETQYLFRNFRRDRLGWGAVPSYTSYIASRIMQPARNAYVYYYYYRHSESRKWPLVRDWSTAAFEGMNFLYEILQRPEPGNYCLETSTNMYMPVNNGANCGTDTMTVGVGPGRFYNTRWSNEYYYKPLVIGSFWDKMIALEQLTDSSAYFYRDFADFFDRGSFSISYYRAFTEEVTQLFKSLINGEVEGYAAEVHVVGGKKTVVPRRLVGQIETGGEPVPHIRPADNYYMKFYSMFNSILGLSSTVDRHLDFMGRARVHLVDEANEPDYDGFDPAELATFVDPHTGYTYRAAPIDALRDPATGAIVDTSRCIGFEMVNKAQDFVTTSWQPAKDAVDATEAACDADPASCDQAALTQAQRDFADAEFQLNELVENLDTMRLFVNILPFSIM